MQNTGDFREKNRIFTNGLITAWQLLPIRNYLSMTNPSVQCHINNHLLWVATWILFYAVSALPCQAQTKKTDHYIRAVELLQKGMLEQAAEICEEGLRNTPENPQLAYLLGQTLFRHAQQLEQRNDSRATALFQRAKQRLLEAEANSQRPLDAGLDHALGSIMLREQNFEKAVNRFTSAIAKARDKAIFYRMRGHTYLEMNKYVTAQRDLRKAVRLDPENHSSQTFLAESFFRSGKIETARQILWDYYSRLTDNDPGPRHTHTLFKIYEYALAANELSDARKALELGLERKPVDNAMQLELATLLYRLGEFKPAVDLLEALLTTSSGSKFPTQYRTQIHRQRALIAQQLDDHVLAKQHLEQALESSPDDAPSLLALTITLRHLGQNDLARTMADHLRTVQREQYRGNE